MSKIKLDRFNLDLPWHSNRINTHLIRGLFDLIMKIIILIIRRQFQQVPSKIRIRGKRMLSLAKADVFAYFISDKKINPKAKIVSNKSPPKMNEAEN